MVRKALNSALPKNSDAARLITTARPMITKIILIRCSTYLPIVSILTMVNVLAAAGRIEQVARSSAEWLRWEFSRPYDDPAGRPEQYQRLYIILVDANPQAVYGVPVTV